jgi:hypothetical protein
MWSGNATPITPTHHTEMIACIIPLCSREEESMSIGNFVKASLELIAGGKYDVALALACSAVDATAAKVYGLRKNNNERYKEFLRDNMPIVTRFGFPGIQAGGIRIKCTNIPDLRTDHHGMVGIEDILYHTLRCGLLHQCEIDKRIEFTTQTYIGDFSERFRLPYQIILGLLMAVVLNESNKSEGTDSDIKLHLEGYKYNLCELWGQGIEALH